MLNHGARIVTDSLVLYLDAANPKSYPGSGTTWFDLSGNEINLSLVNNPTFISGNQGAFEFNGTSSYAGGPIFGLSDHTIEGWINSNQSSAGTGADVSVILGNYGGSNFKYTFIGINGSSLDWRIDNGSNSFRLIANSSFNTNQWYHVALTYNSNGLTTAYLDGVFLGSITSTTNILFDSLSFVVAYQSQNHYFNGLVSSTKMYNRALSENEIKQNFEALRGRYGI